MTVAQYPAIAASAAKAAGQRSVPWVRVALSILALAVLLYLPFVLQSRTVFGTRLTNMQLLNVGLAQVNLTLIAVVGALSLNFLTGCAGLVSIGHAAFFALGAMGASFAGSQLGLPFLATLVIAALVGAFAGVLAGLPSLRVRGLYFVLSTMAVHFIAAYLFSEFQYAFHDVAGVTMPDAQIGGFELSNGIRWYFFLLPIAFLAYVLFRNTLRFREGRALLAMRDNELAAAAAGIDVRILRLKAFAFSSAIAGIVGALQAYYLTTVSAEFYSLNLAIQFIAMIIIGGMGSLSGSVLGAIVWLLLPALIGGLATELKGSDLALARIIVEHKPQVVNLVFGSLVAILLIYAPDGLAGGWRRLKAWLANRRAGGTT